MTRQWLQTGRFGLVALTAFAVLATASLAEAASPRKLTQDRATSSLTLRSDYHAGEVVVPINKSQIIEVDQNVAEVSIGNSEIADVVPLTQRRIYVFGKQLGVTSLTLTGRGGKVIAVVDLAVSFDIDGLKTQLFELVPDQTIEIRPANDGIVLSGQVKSAGQLAHVLAMAERYAPERVTNLLEVTDNQQVMLAVRFAEVQRNVVKQLGFSNLFTVDGSDASGFLFNGDGPSLDPRTFGLANLSTTFGDFSLDFLLDALEEKGVVKTLAEPNLIALSGDSARFLAGGEFPIPVGRDEKDSGQIEVTIAFKEFGVSLSFTPTVISEDLVNLELFTEVSEIDPKTSILFDDLVIPGLKVRRAKTTIELGDAQSFAIAGLLQEGFEDAVRQFPVLGDVPVLGTLFRSTEFQTGQTELVMIVTPHLVQPRTKEELITPGDLFVPPSDAELFLLGRIEGDRPDDPTSPAGRLSRRGAVGIVGPYGYILK
ncbi:MAG: type II and III secretion system protein family protein [Alphaproteobacteria bacterium]|nr:type II and III secretion system protein family protein [Alphaproteobacteria bacterium]